MIEQTRILKQQEEVKNILHNITEKKMRNQNAKYVCMSLTTLEKLVEIKIDGSTAYVRSYVEECNKIFGLQIVLADLPENIVVVGE